MVRSTVDEVIAKRCKTYKKWYSFLGSKTYFAVVFVVTLDWHGSIYIVRVAAQCSG